MNKYSLTSFLLFLSIMGFAQNNNLDYKYALKVYNLTSYEASTKLTVLEDSTGLSSESIEKSLQILQPTIAFQWKSKKSNFHEIELTSLRFGKHSTKTDILNDPNGYPHTILGSDVTTVHISMRYEFILTFNKTKDRKLVPSIGFGANPYFKRINSIPKTATSYPTTDNQTGIRGFVTPRLTYFMTPKFFLDLNLPFCVMDLRVLNSNRLDPILPVAESTITTVDFQQFPNFFSGRIGVGLKL